MSAFVVDAMTSDNNFVDKLKTIRPFTESQLSQLHSINDLKENENVVNCFLYECRTAVDSEFYENVNSFKKAREALNKTRTKLSAVKSECESLECKVWEIESKTIKKRLRCSDGRMVEGKHTYNEANLNKELLKSLERNLQATKNLLSNDYCNNYYTAQICQKNIEAEIQDVITENDSELKTQKLRTLISSLFAFQRTFEEVDAEFVQLIKKWITELVAVILQDASYNDRLFLLNHILRCPGGVTSWTASFVQCKSPLQANDKQDASSVLNHCLTVISTILSPIKDREKFVGTGGNACHNNPDVKLSSDDLWHLVDTDVDEGEDVLINKLNLTETDIIRLLQQVPFDDLLEYIAEKQFTDDFSLCSANNPISEYSMLKLLSVSTKMIQILRQGLITFNCMRFRTLTDYITSLIRKSVCIVSNSWTSCKRKLRTEDQAMLLRLQVEYDHFILRSVVAILSSQRYGVWRFVSVIPFDGVTESMMWHILWVFYNNGRDEVDELGGLCPYFSDSYWRSKFNEPAMKYLFQEKLPTLSVTECECLLRSLGNMIKSRDSNEVEFISTVAVEMFEMGFLMLTVSDKMVSTCTELFSELSLQHPFLISPLVLKIRDSNCFNEQCIDLFEKVPLYLWKPEESILHLLGDWLAKSAFNTIFNRLARLIISKMNWGLNDEQTELFLGIKYHRLMAILLYEAMYEQIKIQEGLEYCNCSVYNGFSEDSFITVAKTETRKAFVEFCWRTAITLKLYLQEQPNWKKISVHTLENSDSIERGFYPLPDINTDCELLSIFKGLELQNPLAIYFTLVMTETGHSVTSFDANVDLLSVLINTKNHIPALDILHWFIPFHIYKMEDILTDPKFVSSMNQLLLSEENAILDRVIGLINSQMKHYYELKKQLFTFWINILCEISGCVLKQYSSSWFIASSKGLQQVVHLLDAIVMLVFGDGAFEHLLTDLLIQKTAEMQSLKLPSSGGWFNWGSSSKKSDWISPLHFLSHKFPNKVWFASALIKSDVVKTEKIWEEVLVEMNNTLDLTVEVALKNVCARLMIPVLPLNVLPICSWAKLAIDSPADHVLLPMIWYNFFTCFFASVETGASMGSRIIGEVLSKKLKVKMNSIIEHFHTLWSNAEGDTTSEMPYTNLMRLYRALLSWLEDTHLHDPFVDVERLPMQYHAELLKSVMNNSDHLMKNYVDEESLEKQISVFFDLWQEVKHLNLNVATVPKTVQNYEFANFGDMKPFKPPEYKHSNVKIQQIDDSEIMNCKSETILALLQQHIRLILEENKYFDNRLAKFSNLNTSLIELISNNYDNIRKEVTTKIACDKDGYDPDGCSGPAAMTFEFYEAFENKQNSKLIERNRIDENNLLGEIFDTPSDRAVSTAIYLTKAISLIAKREVKDENEHLLQSLVSFYLASIPDANNILFAPTKHIFNIILDTLNSESETNRDSTSSFVLQTALSYPQTIQFLAQLLVPSSCTPHCFMRMYQLLQLNIEATPNHVLFVLLSKFDVNSWLKVVSERDSTKFLNILGNALFAFGKNPSDDKLMVLGLYRKHLQYMAICRFPLYLEEVFKIILNGMKNFSIYPLLWNDLLLSFGFYVHFPNVQLSVLVSELQKYANSQPLFCANELYSLLSVICDHFETLKEEKPRLNLLEYFKEYVEPFSVMLSTISFMWINLNSKDLSDFLIVWNPFLKVWKPWIFVSYSGQVVETTDFERIWDLFVANLHYFIHCFFGIVMQILNPYEILCSQGLSSRVLSLSWQLIATELLSNKNQICSKSSKAIQEKLNTLLWKRFVPSENDISLMYQCSQNENNSPNVLLNKILHSVNWRNCAQFIPYNHLSQSMELLAYTIIAVVTDPQNISISDIPLHLINAENAQHICVALRKKINLEYYFDKRDDLMLMWLTMIKIICCIPGSDETDNEELLKKEIIYTNTITGIIEDATKNDEQFFKKRTPKLKFFIESFLDDLKTAFSKDDSSHRCNIFSSIFNFVKALNDDEEKQFVITLFKDRMVADKHLIGDFMSSGCKYVSDIGLLINITEHCFASFAVCGESTLDYLLTKFDKNVISSDFYLNCIHQNAFLSLLLCFEKKKVDIGVQNATVEMIDWCSQVKLKSSTEAKVVAVWYRVVKDAVNSLTPDESSLPLLQSTLRLTKFLMAIVDEVVSQGLLSFMKISKRSVTPRCTFVSLSFAVLLLRRIDEMITNIHPLYSELGSLLKTSSSKVQALKKHKGFVEFVSLLEELAKLYDSENIAEGGVPLIRNWLLTYYSDVPYIHLIIV